MKAINPLIVGLLAFTTSLSTLGVSNDVNRERALLSPDGISFFSKVSITVIFEEVETLNTDAVGEVNAGREFQFKKGVVNIRHANMFFLQYLPSLNDFGGFEDSNLLFNPEIRGRHFPMDKEKFSQLKMVTNLMENKDSEVPNYKLSFKGLYDAEDSNGLVFLSGATRYNPQQPNAINVSHLAPEKSVWGAGNLIFAMVPSYQEALQKAYRFAEDELIQRNPWGSREFHHNINIAPATLNGFTCRTEWEGRMACSFSVEIAARVIQGNKLQGEWL